MHIPDGFINAGVAGVTFAASAGAIALAVKKTDRIIGDKHVPMLGVLAAFTFAAQMLNFPIAGGTSGHLLGAALVAILLGPWAGLLVMSSVLIVQALVFQDGGLMSLGANIFNMGFLATFGSYYLYKPVMKIWPASPRSQRVAAFAAAWLSVMISAAACAVELALSGTVPIRVVLPAMAGIHSLIGIGEGMITVAVLSLIMATRRDLLEMEKT